MAERILVIGASGAQGGAVASKLIDAGWHVLAAARDRSRVSHLEARGAEAVELDLRDVDTVKRATETADYAFFHAPMGLAGPEGNQAERRVLETMLDVGVKAISYNVGFALPPQPVGQPQIDERIELVNEMMATGKVVVFVPTGYLENFTAPWSKPRVAAGELLYPLSPEVRVSWVTNQDVGVCTDAALKRHETLGARYRVAGPESLTLPEVAERIGRAIGRDVKFRQVSGNEYATMLAPFVGEETAQMIGQSYDRMANEQNPMMTPDISETERVLGVHLKDVETWAQSVRWE